MKSTMKRALSLILTALMLLMLLPGSMAEEMNTASAPVIPGLSDGGALVSEVLGESAEKTAAELLYDRLMACETIDEINAMLDGLTEEENALLDQFTDEQNAALEAKMVELGGYTLDTLPYDYDTSTTKFVTVVPGKTEDVSFRGIGNTPSFTSNVEGVSAKKKNSLGDTVTVTVTVSADVAVDTVATLTYTYRNKTYTIVVIVVESDNTGKGENWGQQYYQGNEPVAWDVVGEYSGSKPSAGMNDATNYIKSVKMAGIDVTWGESDTDYRYSSNDSDATLMKKVGSSLFTYFGSDVSYKTNIESITLFIEPQPGYYVSGFWIVCCNNGKPYGCAVMKAGNEYRATFKFADTLGGAVESTVKSAYFGHPDGREDQYFILISVAPIPTPLFVEYNYGEIINHVSDADKDTFYNPASWTATTDGNSYGKGKIDTNNTQYRYTYTASEPAESADWKHFANTVTDAAKTAAANAGYYFAGWKAEYYTTAASNPKTTTTENYKRYNYDLSGKYSAERMYAEGAEVQLLMHVKLTAQWKPIELKVTKTVSGLDVIDDSGLNKNQTYKLTLQKQNADGTYSNPQTVDYAIDGDGTLTKTFAASGADVTQAITPGTYKVVETVVEPIKGTNLNAYCTTTYPSETVVVGTDGTVKELKVLNEFSSKPATTEVTIKKFVEGNMGDWDKAFNFEATVTQNDEKVKIEYTQDQGYEVKEDGTITFSLQHYLENNPTRGSVTIKNIPIGATLTITEKDATDYTTTNSVDNGGKTATYTVKDASDQTITFTNDKTATPDTGVLLDSLPYLLILAVVVIVIVLSIVRKRRNDD